MSKPITDKLTPEQQEWADEHDHSYADPASEYALRQINKPRKRTITQR